MAIKPVSIRLLHRSGVQTIILIPSISPNASSDDKIKTMSFKIQAASFRIHSPLFWYINSGLTTQNRIVHKADSLGLTKLSSSKIHRFYRNEILRQTDLDMQIFSNTKSIHKTLNPKMHGSTASVWTNAYDL